MAAYRRVYDSRHLQADCQEPGSAPDRTLGNRVSATFTFFLLTSTGRNNARCTQARKTTHGLDGSCECRVPSSHRRCCYCTASSAPTTDVQTPDSTRQHQDEDRTPPWKSQSERHRTKIKWRKYVHGVANPQIDDGKITEQN